jgi:outer membrane protein insertion porin family
MKKLLFFLVLSGLSAFADRVADVKVRALDGFGGDVSAVLARCQTKEGRTYDPAVVTRDVKSLEESGLFQEIHAETHAHSDGVEVIFFVKRKMRYIAPMRVTGCDFYTPSRIVAETGLKDGGLYGEGDFAMAAEKVRRLYLGKRFPRCKVSLVPTVRPGGNDCTVAVAVEEGSREKTGTVRFEGVTDDEAAALRETIGFFPWWDPRGWFSQTPSTDEQWTEAREKLRRFFVDRGYLDATLSDVERVAGASAGETDYLFKVAKGTLYTVGSTAIEGLTRYPAGVVAERSRLPAKGDVAGEKALSDAAHRVQVTVGSGDSGLAGTDVSVRRLPREDDPSVVDLVFVVSEGTPAVIDRVAIEGNDYTKDKVIRREITLAPGNRYLEDHAERSKRRLENLDYFSRVNYFLRQSDRGRNERGETYYDLVYEVAEKNTGSFMVGLGASSVDSVYVSAEISQANFDLFAPGKLFRGAGQKGRLFAQCGPRIQSYEASVTEPFFLDRMLELTLEGYRRQRWYDDYDIVRTGGGASLSYPMNFVTAFNGSLDPSSWSYRPFGRFGVRWSGELIGFDDIESGDWYLGEKVVSLDEEKRRYDNAFESVFRFFWSHDTRDSYRIPTSGTRTMLFCDVAAGDNEYWKLGFNHRRYYTLFPKYRHVLMLALRGETMDAFSGGVPIYNRLFLGGPKSVRGIEYRNVSPFVRRERDGSATDEYMPWGGQTLFCANVEYTIPIVKMLRLAVFSDVGSVGADPFDLDFADTFAWTVGLGIRLDVPMFPIRLDFATPVKKPDNADKETFCFSVGYDF